MVHVIRKNNQQQQQYKPTREPVSTTDQQRPVFAVYPYRKCLMENCTRPGIAPHWYCKPHAAVGLSRPPQRTTPERFGGA
jgi:hypothetical protein